MVARRYFYAYSDEMVGMIRICLERDLRGKS